MASINRERNGRRTIQFVGADGKRRSIRLGKVSQRTAEGVKVKVEALAAAAMTGHSLDDEVSSWLAKRDGAMLDKLAAVGLIPKRETATLGAFLGAYLAARTDVKPLTQKKYESTRRSLVAFFGRDRRLRDITPGDAEDWRRTFSDKGKAENTVRKHTAVAKLFFGAAVKKHLIPVNPFSHLKAAILPNRERFYFVTHEETQQVIDACPDAEWRLIVALARYGGLRCPSEHFALRWRDVDWEHDRVKVTSPKTAHHAGHDSRVIPLFPELRPYLEAAFEAAPEGAEYVLGDRYRQHATNLNLRSRLLDIIWAAGLKEWPKLFQNMRSSRETELGETFPMHVVVAWLGNSEPVALKHYMQVTDEHYERALKAGAKAVQNPVQQAPGNAGKSWQPSGIARDFQGLPICTSVQLAEAGFEPARAVRPTGF